MLERVLIIIIIINHHAKLFWVSGKVFHSWLCQWSACFHSQASWKCHQAAVLRAASARTPVSWAARVQGQSDMT